MANSTLKPVVDGWLKKIRLAAELRKRDFGDDAEECMRFYNGPYSWLYKKRQGERGSAFDYDPEGDEDIPAPTFQITINKAAEVVQLFGPAMYQRNPDRKVSPRRTFLPPLEYFGPPDDPNTQMIWQQVAAQVNMERGKDTTRAALLESYLNFTPVELNLEKESRRVIDEALITGLSCYWCEIVEMPSGLKVVGTFYDSWENLLLDPDAKRIEDCQWIARKCCHPCWAVEREYGLEPGSLKGNMESASKQAEGSGDQEENYERAKNATNDLVVYYKVWSKMGLGGRLKGVMTEFPGWREELESLGDYCFLAVCDSCDHPLNIPPTLAESQDQSPLAQAVEWPIPFWLDRGEWPVTLQTFHEVPNRLWPMSHLKPALGELKFINWMFSFMASKVRITSRDFLVVSKSLADEAKRAIKHGGDYTVIEAERMIEDIDKAVKFIQHPSFNPEIYRVLENMITMFDKRTGLTELAYGQTEFQLRSAEEARVKQQNASIRPADMGHQVEQVCSVVSRKEMAAARWALTDKDVEPVLGKVGAALWKTEILSTNPAELFHQFDCRVESGTTKRPDRDRDTANMQQGMQMLLSPLFSYAQGSGDVGPFNALVGGWAKSVGADGDHLLLKAPPPPPPPAPVQSVGNEEKEPTK